MNCCGCKELSQHCVWHGDGYFDEQFYCKKCKDSSVDFDYENKLNVIQRIILEVRCLIHKYTRW